MEKIRYPIGQFVAKSALSVEERNKCLQGISDIAKSLRDVLKDLDHEQLQVPYRPGGWTSQQVVHHMADNDINAYLRLKRALTEDEPVASSYREDLFAELSDYRDVPVQVSIALLESLHTRLVALLRGGSQNAFNRQFSTQALGRISIDTALQRFLWHNQHHIAQIASIIK
ncbi:putative metal-dependent hydrolase [Paenibacillus marchantiophytorum]|uniref:Metal-dependent hydrolase n=1 Tax=Paenibacillus marchantiophytorum TaxID=1619310 RepID=A0ABQ1FI77_9BACL|nr:putative metal-dependent hydrolase [Paenibacillus marchantiophytorum]GGA15540.1 putative metal-dependent hydrolase [Paenibacillus marchantiophytorum]